MANSSELKVNVQLRYVNFRWETAKNACHEDNAELALPTNEEDNKIFSDKVGYGRYDLWIGAEFEPAPSKFHSSLIHDLLTGESSIFE